MQFIGVFQNTPWKNIRAKKYTIIEFLVIFKILWQNFLDFVPKISWFCAQKFRDFMRQKLLILHKIK